MPDETSIDRQPGALPPCPFLPEAPEEMSWRSLNELGNDRGNRFFLRSLQYGQYLWSRRMVARAILSVDRALLADVSTSDNILEQNPLPYRALTWMIKAAPAGSLVGNPRVHYQHLADRIRGERAQQRSWRAWGMWHISCLARPEFPADPKHHVVEPTVAQIREGLQQFGVTGELAWWVAGCEEASAAP